MHVTVTGMFDIHRLRFSALVVLVVLGVLWFLSWVSPQGATLVDKILKIQDGSVMRTSLLSEEEFNYAEFNCAATAQKENF